MNQHRLILLVALTMSVLFPLSAKSGPAELLQSLHDLSSSRTETEGLVLRIKTANRAARKSADIQYRRAQMAINDLMNGVASDIQSKRDVSAEKYRESIARCQRELEDFRAFLQTRSSQAADEPIKFDGPMMMLIETLPGIISSDSKEPEMIRKALYGLRFRDFERILEGGSHFRARPQ